MFGTVNTSCLRTWQFLKKTKLDKLSQFKKNLFCDISQFKLQIILWTILLHYNHYKIGYIQVKTNIGIFFYITHPISFRFLILKNTNKILIQTRKKSFQFFFNLIAFFKFKQTLTNTFKNRCSQFYLTYFKTLKQCL